MNKENELLKLDATSRHTVISDLIEKNNQILQEIHELSLWKEEAEREQIASDILAKRIVELESDVARQRSKYQNAMKALSGMEEALLVRHYVCSCISSFDANMILYISYTHSLFLSTDCRNGTSKTSQKGLHMLESLES